MAIHDKTYIQNEMLKYRNNPITIKFPNTQKLQDEVEDLDRNVPVFPKTLKKVHQCMCGNKDR